MSDRDFEHRPLSTCVARVPLLPIETLVTWVGDAAALRPQLRALVEDPVVREALFIASPVLVGELARWIANPDDPETRGVEQSLVRYLARMAARPTPFGLFSTLGVGRVGGATQLAIGPRATARRHVRLENDYLARAATTLAADPDIAATLVYRPNSSLYRAAGRLRYAEVREEPQRAYHLVELEPTDYLLAVIARAEGGATRAELVATLCADPDIGADNAAAFVDQLVASQILVDPLAPQVTGREPTDPLIEQLAAGGNPRAAEALRAARDQLATISEAPLGIAPAAYEQVVTALEPLGVPVTLDRLVQVDLFRSASELVVGDDVVKEVTRGLALLHRIGAGSDSDGMGAFRTAFTARYDQREMPLVDVLDDEIGIGFGHAKPLAAPLLDVAPPTRPPNRQVAWSARETHLLSLVATGARVLDLTPADEAALARDPMPRLADSFVAPIAIAAASPAALAQGAFLVRILPPDAPGARMLGRFCHGEPAIEALTRELVGEEAARRPDAAFAEIAHLPDGRVGNVLLRPVLRDYEIPYLGRSGLVEAQQLPVTDLLVSVVDGRVVLRSRRLDREVVPCLTTAHNYQRGSLAMYRFLGTLAQQGRATPQWSWGALGDAPRLPRVTSGRVVIARARWVLGASDIGALAAASSLAAGVAALRTRLEWPRWIVLADADNELAVDLDNPLSVASFANLVRGQTTAIVLELFPAPGELAVTSDDGHYVHELQLFYSRPVVAAPVAPVRARPGVIARSFPPGSPWLFVKYYAGPSVQDDVLRLLVPALREVVAAGHATQWFFLRYADPDPHLRVRVEGEAATLLSTVLPRLAEAVAPALEAGIVWRTQLDTYEREVERYGGASWIETAERIFAADSEAAATIIEAYPGAEGTELLWRATLVGIDRMFDDLGLDEAAKRRRITSLRDTFGAEVRMDTDHQRRLGEKYRRVRAEVEAALTESEPALAPARAAFAVRSTAIRALAPALAGTDLPELAGSFVHMHVNRVLAASPRAQELVLYDLLRRYYDMVAGKRKQAR